MYGDEVYPTAEHAYHAAKATNERDRQRIKAVRTPAIAKKFGRQISIRRDWENAPEGIRSFALERLRETVALYEKVIGFSRDTERLSVSELEEKQIKEIRNEIERLETDYQNDLAVAKEIIEWLVQIEDSLEQKPS